MMLDLHYARHTHLFIDSIIFNKILNRKKPWVIFSIPLVVVFNARICFCFILSAACDCARVNVRFFRICFFLLLFRLSILFFIYLFLFGFVCEAWLSEFIECIRSHNYSWSHNVCCESSDVMLSHSRSLCMRSNQVLQLPYTNISQYFVIRSQN